MKYTGSLLTGDFEDNTMTFKIDGELILRAGKYEITQIEVGRQVKNNDKLKDAITEILEVLDGKDMPITEWVRNRLLDAVGQSEQLVCDHQWKIRFSEKRGSWRLCTKCRKES